jgi:hypothetical protein
VPCADFSINASCKDKRRNLYSPEMTKAEKLVSESGSIQICKV